VPFLSFLQVLVSGSILAAKRFPPDWLGKFYHEVSNIVGGVIVPPCGTPLSVS